MKRQFQTVWFVLALAFIGVVMLSGGVPFLGEGSLDWLGAAVQICDNQEPANLTALTSTVLGANGSLSGLTTTTKTWTRSDNTTVSFNHTIQSISVNGANYSVNVFGGLPVYQYKDMIRSQAATLLLTTYRTKTAFVADGKYYWSNQADNLLFVGDEAGLIAYTNLFVSCRFEENKTTEQLVCEAKGAGYDPADKKCVCPGEKVWNATSGCITPLVTTTYSKTVTTTSTTTKAVTTSNNYPVAQDAAWWAWVKANKVLVIMGVTIVFLLYYFLFEKGSSHGLIKKRR